MALQTSGQISLDDIHVEAGGTTLTEASINDPDILTLISKTANTEMSFSEWYGASGSAELTLPIPNSSTNINGQSQYKEIIVSDYINSGDQLTIPSSIWIWSDSTSTAALTIDIPCTIINNGKIIGKGGAGGNTQSSGSAGGPAIKINTSISGVTITNGSGAYIAGGGGGGGGTNNGSNDAGGGGGAGGGVGGSSAPSSASGGSGGILNAYGANGAGWNTGNHAYGGSAGGAGGYCDESSSGNQYGTGAGGGGRILPGTQTANHSAGQTPLQTIGKGGGGGQAGTNGGSSGNGSRGAGGGGWGAAGGAGSVTSGGAAGKAIEDSGTTYTLNNSGTIYGETGITPFTSTSVLDNIGTSLYRNYMESTPQLTGKRSYTGTGYSSSGNADTYKNTAAPSLSVSWGSLPSEWAGASGSTILFINVAQAASAVSNAYITDSGGTQRSISLTSYEQDITTYESNIGYFASNDNDYSLNGATIGGTFNKTSDGRPSMQKIIAIPGNWTRVRSGYSGPNTSTQASNLSANSGDIVIAVSVNDTGNTSASQHAHPLQTNLTLRGGTIMNVGNGYCFNTKVYTASGTWSLRAASSQETSGSNTGAAYINYWQLRYVG